MARLGRRQPFRPHYGYPPGILYTGSVTVSITGQEATVGQGSVGELISVAIAGQEVSAVEGSVGVSSSVAIAGQEASVARGSASPLLSVTITGQEVTAGQGSVGVGSAVAITGQEVSVGQGVAGNQSVSPSGGSFVTIGSPSAPTTGFARYNGSVVSSPFGKTSLAYLIRTDKNQVAALDTVTGGAVDFMVYHFHPFTGDAQNHELRKKVVRINIFGEGSISTAPGGAYLVIIADESRTDVYPYASYCANPSQQIIWSVNPLNLPGRQFDIVLLLTGAGIKIRELGFQYTIIG